MLRSDSLFARQNFWLKLVIMLQGTAISIATPYRILILSTLLIYLYLLIVPAIFPQILIGLRRMLPYFAGYALMAVIFNVSVVEVLIFLLRLSDLIVLMVYFSATLNLRRMLGDCQALKTNKHTAMVFYLFIAIAVFIRRFRQFYQHSAFAAKNSKSSPGSYILSIFSILPALVEAITINWQNREQVEAISSRIYSRHYQSFPLLTRANVSGCVLITLLILVISL